MRKLLREIVQTLKKRIMIYKRRKESMKMKNRVAMLDKELEYTTSTGTVCEDVDCINMPITKEEDNLRREGAAVKRGLSKDASKAQILASCFTEAHENRSQ